MAELFKEPVPVDPIALKPENPSDDTTKPSHQQWVFDDEDDEDEDVMSDNDDIDEKLNRIWGILEEKLNPGNVDYDQSWADVKNSLRRIEEKQSATAAALNSLGAMITDFMNNASQAIEGFKTGGIGGLMGMMRGGKTNG